MEQLSSTSYGRKASTSAANPRGTKYTESDPHHRDAALVTFGKHNRQTHRWTMVQSTSEAPSFGERPPPVQRQGFMPLPELSVAPVYLHPMLHYSISPAVAYDLSLPPSSASAPVARHHVAYRDWRKHLATKPADIGSMTIRIAGVARPVVVLPARRNAAGITIDDVLSVVHWVLRTAAIEQASPHRQETGFGLWGERRECAIRHTEEQVVQMIKSLLQGKSWWAGLYQSDAERDVWILETCRGH